MQPIRRSLMPISSPFPTLKLVVIVSVMGMLIRKFIRTFWYIIFFETTFSDDLFLDNLLVLPFAHSSDNLTHLYSIGSADSFQLEVKSASKKRKWVESVQIFKFSCIIQDGKPVCQCKHGTEGETCNKCMPFHHDRPWKRGTQKHPNECVSK